MWRVLLLVGIAVAHPSKRDYDVCSQPMDPGPCEALVNAWYFDKDVGICMDFIYGGCGGNDNNFSSEEECQGKCQKDVCSQPMDPGPCEALVNAWYFDKDVGICTDFIYGGCGGNDNNFSSEEECQGKCLSQNA